ncbi:hypothetical protein PI125_g26784 [Phytophthora idaei]|nr:hypothetical protein PI125_g26784 [Phytophthora idaei]
MKTHPAFYVGRLKWYHDSQGPAAPQTPQASREEEDPTPRNETQPQTSSNVQRRKVKTLVVLVDREASGTPEGPRTDEPQLGKPSTHHSHTAQSTAERTGKSACGVAISRRSLRPSASKDETIFKLFKLQTLGHVTERDLEVRETRLGHYRRLIGAPLWPRCRSRQAVLIINNGTGRIRIERTRTDGHGTKTRRPLGAMLEKARRPFKRSAMIQEESLSSEESLGMRSGP